LSPALGSCSWSAQAGSSSTAAEWSCWSTPHRNRCDTTRRRRGKPDDHWLRRRCTRRRTSACRCCRGTLRDADARTRGHRPVEAGCERQACVPVTQCRRCSLASSSRPPADTHRAFGRSRRRSYPRSVTGPSSPRCSRRARHGIPSRRRGARLYSRVGIHARRRHYRWSDSPARRSGQPARRYELPYRSSICTSVRRQRIPSICS
jgi:hypothetical protein